MRSLAILAIVVGCYRSEAPPQAPAAKPAPQARHARTASDPLGFLPAGAHVIHLDVVQLRQSAVWARFEPTIMGKAGPVMAQFQALCGFDPLPMIQSVAIGLRGVDTPELGGVFVLRGIQRSQMMPCIEKAVAQQPTVGAIDRGIVTIRGDANEPPVVFAFADARTIVIAAGHGSSPEALRLTLDAGAPLRGSPAFMEMFGRIDLRRAAWFFLDGNSKLFDSMATLGFKPQAVFGSVDLTTGLAAKLFVRLPDPTAAQTLVTTFQSQLGAFQSLVQKLELVAEDSDVVVDLALDDSQLAMLATLLGP